MKKCILVLFTLLFSHQALAQLPKPEFLLQLSHSVPKVHVENAQGQLGVGSSVVVAKNHVATNCHVVANARGVAINKIGKSFAPIAMKADWHHDLCILIFDDLPLKPFPLANINDLDYEDPIIAIGFSGNSAKPTESFGAIKALIPFDDSVLIRTSSGFRMGASGGALLDYDGKLLGITTFKSPGRNGFYYSLPVTWIKSLLASPTLVKTTDAKKPFWDAIESSRPYFMQAVIPFQNKNWVVLNKVAQSWVIEEPKNPEAWFYLGQAKKGMNEIQESKKHLQHVIMLAPNHTSAIHALGKIAILESDLEEAERLGLRLKKINADYAEYYFEETGLKPAPKTH